MLVLTGGWISRVCGGKNGFVFRKVLFLCQESVSPLSVRVFLIWPISGTIQSWMHAPSLVLPSLSLRLCDPLSPRLERPSLPILDNCESLLIGLQRKRITWVHNDVMARGPSYPSFSPPPIKTKSSSAPNVLETIGLTFCSASCMHASGQTTVFR